MFIHQCLLLFDIVSLYIQTKIRINLSTIDYEIL